MSDTIETLQARVLDLEQQVSDLEIALQTAIEHGDAIDYEISAANRRLVGEMAERVRAEARLERLVAALVQQKTDLEILVSTVSEHSDDIDTDWLKRFTEVEQQALTDELTNLANRRGLNIVLDRAWRRHQRSESSLALIMADVDLFKSYNDRFGHPAGDACLKLIGRILRQACMRPEDLPARYGGEEFLVMLPDTGMDGALKVVENIRTLLAEEALPHPASPFGVVTLSFGVAAEIPGSDRDMPLLLAEADHRLYNAKRDGRNSCCTS